MIRAFITGWLEGRLIKKTLKEQRYYTNIDELLIFNFFKIKNGFYEYLWRHEKDRGKKYPKGLFLQVFQDMYFQFNKLDNTYLRNLADLADYESKYARTGLSRWKNEYNTLKAKIERTKPKDLNMDDFTDYIEHSLGHHVGSIDVHRTSISKAFNNYFRALEKNKKHANN